MNLARIIHDILNFLPQLDNKHLQLHKHARTHTHIGADKPKYAEVVVYATTFS